MGTMTSTDMLSELAYYLEGRTISAARRRRWINQAYRMISFPSVHKHWELEAKILVPMVADTFEYTLATSAGYVTREILGVRGARYVHATTDDHTVRHTQLGARSIGYFNAKTLTVTGSGPSEYGVFRKTLLVSPAPSSAIAGNLVVLEVWEEPALLTGVDDSETTVLLDWWDEAILLGAKWIGEAALGFGEAAEASKQTFMSYIQVTPERETIGSDDEESFMADINLGDSLQPR